MSLRKLKFYAYYNIKYTKHPTGQAFIERSNQSIRAMLYKQKGMENTPRNRLHSALLTLNFLNTSEKGTTATERLSIEENLLN